MKTASKIVFYLLAITVLSWFLPWLYSLLTPEAKREPYMAWSPVSNSWVWSMIGDDNRPEIKTLNSANEPMAEGLSREQRDSLLPQTYYRDLMAREQLPDTIQGLEVTVPALKHSEVILTSSPRDIVKVQPDLYLIMESMPLRADLEDPKEAMRMLDDGSVEFITMATGEVNRERSRRFSEAFRIAGFVPPIHDANADITARKQRDDGYMLIDADGQLFHFKQQAGRPYLTRVKLPDGISADKAYILEAMDPTHVAFMVDTEGRSYFIDIPGYQVRQLEIPTLDPRSQRITIMGNLFNIVVRSQDATGSQWTAVDSRSLKRLGCSFYPNEKSAVDKAEAWIFPYILTFASTSDSLAYPRYSHWSWRALFLNLILALILLFSGPHKPRECSARSLIPSVVTLFLGLYSFIPFLLCRDR